ncbi:MAG: hypothetical protein AAGC79_18190 [Pseudomonadota bacterium]
MTLQNRVNPDGEITDTAWRGALMGNRGCLHDSENRLGRARWRHRNWVCCVTEFRDRHRLAMPPPGSPTVYTALFFWDEATAFSAGHRPCGECRNAEYRRFKSLWNRAGLGETSAKEIDRVLHAARLPLLKGEHPGITADVADLPNGTIIRPGQNKGVYGLLWQGQFYQWQATGGYAPPERCRGKVKVLTPEPILQVFAEGYVPFVRLAPEDQFTSQPV